MLPTVLGASSVQVFEHGWALAAVGMVALATTAISVRLRFRGERLFGSRTTTFYTLVLISVSTGAAVGVATVRPLGLAFLGVAAPVPFRPQQQNRDSHESRDGVSSSVTTMLGLIAKKLAKELGGLKGSICEPMVSVLRDDPTACAKLADAMRRRVYYLPIADKEKTNLYMDVKAALDSCGKGPVPGPNHLVKLVYEWDFRDLLIPSKKPGGSSSPPGLP